MLARRRYAQAANAPLSNSSKVLNDCYKSQVIRVATTKNLFLARPHSMEYHSSTHSCLPEISILVISVQISASLHSSWNCARLVSTEYKRVDPKHLCKIRIECTYTVWDEQSLDHLRRRKDWKRQILMWSRCNYPQCYNKVLAEKAMWKTS